MSQVPSREANASSAAPEKDLRQRAAYIAEFAAFANDEPHAILGSLTVAQDGDVTPAQRDAWLRQIVILKASLPAGGAGVVCFEFTIPRIGKRADNILLIGNLVVVLEFKVGATVFDADAKRQVVDYALDLKNFHQGSHDAIIVPVLVAANAPTPPAATEEVREGVRPVICANAKSLLEVLKDLYVSAMAPATSPEDWLASGYRPTPTIIEASQALYRGHDVADITHSEAGADNLGATTDVLNATINLAREHNQKIICFVSGVPGAGKTLAGLNLVCERRRVDAENLEHAVYLSGNGPLVSVLQEALARDEVTQGKAKNLKVSKSDAKRKAVAFIQNIHHFRDESLRSSKAPVERVVVFDEAQRAWDRAQTSNFMARKRDQPGFDASEPEFLIRVMDRHVGWAVIVCLVGGGQEINTGEAGIEEWLRALRDHFPHWQVRLPDQLEQAEYLPTFKLVELGPRVDRIAQLHLSVSLRSFRCEQLSAGISALMSGDIPLARDALAKVTPTFPILITRSLDDARHWVRGRARGSERIGMLASSGAKRLKPLGVNMDQQLDPCVWFLNDTHDVRSSHYLEDVASEFDVQGLELDWAVIVWDADLIANEDGWRYRNFRGTKWQTIHSLSAQQYRKNAYRVLLTRARQGMVIVVPEGNEDDPTRPPATYDATWTFLIDSGLTTVNA